MLSGGMFLAGEACRFKRMDDEWAAARDGQV